MGLLDNTYAKAKALAGLLFDAYQTGAQAYFPNEQDVKARPELAKGLLQFVPGPGDAISGYDAVQSAKQGNYGEAALNGVGLLPFIPAMGGVIRNIYHGTSPEAAAIINRRGFDLKQSADGTVWFTENPVIGDVGAARKGGIVHRQIDDEKLKLGGWPEYDRYGTGELKSMGYDGLKLEDGPGEFTVYRLFNPNKTAKKAK